MSGGSSRNGSPAAPVMMKRMTGMSPCIGAGMAHHIGRVNAGGEVRAASSSFPMNGAACLLVQALGRHAAAH